MLKGKITKIVKDKMGGITVIIDVMDSYGGTVVIPSFNIPIEQSVNEKNYETTIREEVSRVLGFLSRKAERLAHTSITDEKLNELIGLEIVEDKELSETPVEVDFDKEKRELAKARLSNLDFSQSVDVLSVLKDLLTYLRIEYKE